MDQQIIDHLKNMEYILKCLPRIEVHLKQIADSNQQIVALLGQMSVPATTIPLDVQVSTRKKE